MPSTNTAATGAAVNPATINPNPAAMTDASPPPLDAVAAPATPAVPLEASGAIWCARFPASNRIADCVEPFRQSLTLFVDAMKAAGATVNIANTYRPPERAWLMHWSWLIVNAGSDPREVPSTATVGIRWDHTDDTGAYSKSRSVAAAQAMVDTYGLQNLRVAPALDSRHTHGLAVDMSISWAGTLSIVDGTGETVGIVTAPQSGMNDRLWRVGATYGVIKFVGGDRDKPHWSQDGH